MFPSRKDLPTGKVSDVDADEASQALTEMHRRTEQTLRQGSRNFPAWYTWSSAATLVVVFASTDVSGYGGSTIAIAGALANVALTVALQRRTGVRLRQRSLRWAPLAALLAAMVVTAIVVGSMLRYFDVPLAGALGGVAAALVWIVGMAPAQAAAGTPRNAS